MSSSYTYSLKSLNFLFKKLSTLSFFKNNLFLFYGSLGAGKTSFIKEMAKILGSNSCTNSPTYTYVNVYLLDNNKKLYHFDLYRIKAIEELHDTGFFEYINEPNALVCIEWPEILEPYLKTRSYLSIHIDYTNNLNNRSITIY